MKPQSLRERAGAISFDDIGTTPAGPASGAERPRTGVGAISASLAMGKEVVDENERLKAQLQHFEDAQVIELLDPEEIGPSEFANRDESAFSTPEFAELKREIESAGRNVQPIKVRRLATPRGKIRFEIVFGHRRHRSCSELRLPVRAFVEEASDEQLVIDMERENRGRANLSAWEQGKFYAKVLDKKVFRSIRHLAERLDIDHALVSRAVQLATLPPEIVAAFPSPLDLQYRWAAPLQQAVNQHESAVLAKAKEFAALKLKPSAKEIYETLISVMPTGDAGPQVRDFSLEGKGVVASWTRDARGTATLKIKPGALTEAGERKLLDLLGKLFS